MAEWVASLGIWWYILFFFAIQLINVVLNTLKTIITAHGKKFPAAIINALTFGFYTIVVALTADMTNLWVNMAVTVIANLTGVYFSILVLDKLRKDRLWEIVATVKGHNSELLDCDLLWEDISFNVIETKANEYVFHIYAENQKQSAKVKELLINYNAKYIVHEETVKL